MKCRGGVSIKFDSTACRPMVAWHRRELISLRRSRCTGVNYEVGNTEWKSAVLDWGYRVGEEGDPTKVGISEVNYKVRVPG
ncbi:hypothetical protein GW17_00007763 [Ensete ventricosum]|nr:hypothetical protein GW17_00007763 [Ensete ventricosum]RZR78472.1 hypothetical protein BHM03_00003825 [Ensete ventricosum]